MIEIVKNDKYWSIHKKLINDKYDKLDAEEYQRVISDPHCPVAIKINMEVENEIKKILTA